MEFIPAPDILQTVVSIVTKLEFTHIKTDRVVCFRSSGSKARALARIWSLPRVWQLALDIPAHYVIEVISERFDALPVQKKERVLIHELLHVPKTFSGGLVPHNCFGRKIDSYVEKYYAMYRSKL